MEINIYRRLFINDPAIRFAKYFNCSPDTWRQVWKRYKFLDYTQEEAREYLIAILHIPISQERFTRWLQRTEVYTRAQLALRTGRRTVQPDYFKPYNRFVIRELTKNDKT